MAITLRFENVLNDIAYYLFLGVIAVFFTYQGRNTYGRYHSDVEKIDELFTKVQNGEVLPSITELIKKKKE